MFVEVVRLIIVLLATAAGFDVARRAIEPDGGAVVVGAILGALVGYVAGGTIGRFLRRAMGALEEEVDRAPAPRLLAGVVGAALLGLLSAVISAPAVVLVPGHWGWPVAALVVWIGTYEGYRIAAAKSGELLAMAGLTAAAGVDGTAPRHRDGDLLLLDTSSVIDGRLLAVAEAGFLRGRLAVPRFVLGELQGIADAQDPHRRRRGRRGLDVLGALGRTAGVEVLEQDVPEFAEVDAKLVALARRLGADLVTTDSALARVAELQGIRCLSVQRLADALRPVLLSGDVIRLPIAREGREPGQGVGFLDDGTMVVVGDAAGLVGREVDVRVTSNVQTSVGRMLFASLVAAPLS